LNDFFYGHAGIYALARESSWKAGEPTLPCYQFLAVSTQTQKGCEVGLKGTKKKRLIGRF
jgi:hypothetical protein